MTEKKKVSTTIEIPMGYRLAPGPQPRQALPGDTMYKTDWDSVEVYSPKQGGMSSGEYFILLKELPCYSVVVKVDKRTQPGHGYQTTAPECIGPHVHMKALAASLELCLKPTKDWTKDDVALYAYLEQLVKDYDGYLTINVLEELIKHSVKGNG